MSNGGSGQYPPAPASREIHPWCETRGHGAHSFAPGDRGFESRSLHRRVWYEPDFLGLEGAPHSSMRPDRLLRHTSPAEEASPP